MIPEIEVRVFTREDGRKVYAVTGFTFTGTVGSRNIARVAVARFKKESIDRSASYHTEQGFIRKYKDGLDGLYTEGKGTPCIMVWK